MPDPLHVAATLATGTGPVVDALGEAFRGLEPTAVLVFASASHDAPSLATALAERFPGAITAGCTTMGEVGPEGATEGGVSAVALVPPVRAAATLIDLASFQFEDGRATIDALTAQIGASRLSADRHVFLTLTDGLSGTEEILVASLGVYAPGVPLVGGSAGDDFEFDRTWAWVDGESHSAAAAVILLEPRVPFHPFHVHHYQPTERRVVVTDADPARRMIRELDGFPALEVLASLLGESVEALRTDPQAILAHRSVTFGFQAGETFYLRGIMTVQDDGSLLMGGAVEEGAVLALMEGGDLVDDTRLGVQQALEALGGSPSGMVLFSCGGRQLEARARGVVEPMVHAMSPVPAAGFVTYGEQFGPMQINHTLTGLLLGEAQP